MILAVIEARAGIAFSGLDVYLNVAGGMRVNEPAADLAVAAALLSARENVPLAENCVFFGELSLSGALRTVAQTENRLKEAQKLGFTRGIGPVGGKQAQVSGIDIASFVVETFGTT
jgi:DNA repair protein RadA/Sms